MQTAKRVVLTSITLRSVQSSGRRRRGEILHKSFRPLAPLEVTLAFSDKGPEYYKTILS